MTTIHDFTCETLKGESQSLAAYKGNVVLIVNTASKCGFTPQFAGLETMYSDLKGEGLMVLGFPCNQFASQDPGTNEEIEEFCQLNYGVTFPMFAKIDVNGDDAAPIYKHLKTEKPGIMATKKIKWNFTKFLCDREGRVMKRFAPSDRPEQIRQAVKDLL